MKRVLIVDDNVSFTEFLDATVQAAGHETLVVHNGSEALEAWDELHPDLVFLDVLLPKMDGFKVCTQIRSRGNGGGEVPIVLMTGIYTKRTYQQDALRTYGASDYLVKPFAITDIWKILERRLGLGDGASTSETEGFDGTPGTLPQSEREAFGGVSLRDRPLARVLGELRDEERTGLLFLKGAVSTDVFFFEQGRLVFVRSNDDSQRLDRILEAKGILTPHQVDEARKLMVESRGHSRMGQILVSLGHLDEDRLRSVVQSQLRARIHAAFRNEDLAFTFVEGPLPQDEDIRVPLDTDNVILDGMREMSTDTELRRHLPSGETILARTGRRCDELHLTAFEKQVLDLANGRNTVDQILDVGRLAQVDVSRILLTLHSLGLVRAGERGEQAPAEAADPERTETESSAPHDAEPFPLPPGGDLRSIPPARVLAAMHRCGISGILELHGEDVIKELVVQHGQVVFARSNDPEDRLGQVLVEGGILSDEEREKVVARIEASPDKRIGQLLVEDGVLGLEELRWAVVFQVQRIVTSCLAWSRGRYRLREGDFGQEENILVELRTPDLLLEGLRRLPQDAVEEFLPDPDVILRPASDAERRIRDLRLTALERAVWTAASDGACRAELRRREVATGGELEVALHAFCALGLLDEGEIVASPAPTEEVSRPEAPARPAPQARPAPPPEPTAPSASLLDDLAGDAAEALTEDLPELARRQEESSRVPRFLYEQLLGERRSLEESLGGARGTMAEARRRLERVESTLHDLLESIDPAGPVEAEPLLCKLAEMESLCHEAADSLRSSATTDRIPHGET